MNLDVIATKIYLCKMKKKIAVLPGDGIGPEIIAEAVKVLKAIEKKYNHEFEYEYGLIGADAIDKTENPYPDATHELCFKCRCHSFWCNWRSKIRQQSISKNKTRARIT
jgi:isocitrate/isopropylmalate dehydrogenase